MKTLLIVFHSRTGGAQQMAQAAARGAGGELDVRTNLVTAQLARPHDILDADGVIYACPENLAAMSGEMKAFFDGCYYPLLDRVAGKPYALMVCAGSDGEGAVRQMQRIITGWRMRAVAEPVIVITGAQTPEAILAAKTLTPEQLEPCEALGAAFTAGISLGVF